MTDTIQPTILFKRPETITGTVEFPLPDGTAAKLACTFQYRTKKEFGALWDEIANATLEDVKKPAKSNAKKGEAEKKEAFSFEALMGQGDAVNAKNTLRYLVAWPDEMPALNAENLMAIFNEAPASAGAFWNAYRALCTTGTTGN